MSLTWRERLARAKRKLIAEMNMSEKDMSHVEENIGPYCRESDEKIRLIYGENCNVDREVAQMSEEKFLELTSEIIDKIMAVLGYTPEKKIKKKKKKEEDQEDTAESSETKKEIIAQ